jgi:hypothetical protein
VVVELGVLELRQVERGRVLHEPHARAVAEAVGEQALDERRRAGERLAGDDDPQLEQHEPPEPGPRAGAALRGRHHGVDDELPHPQREERHARAHEAQRDDGRREAAVRRPHHAQQGGDVAQRGEALAPARRRGGRGGARRAVPSGGLGGRHARNVRRAPPVGHRPNGGARRVRAARR